MPLGTDVFALVESIWGTVLGWEVQPLDADGAFEAAPDALIGIVNIDGPSAVEVRLGCPADLARQAAGVMLGLPPEAVSADDVRDALGELTNMLGGNLKALLPGTNALGLPRVAWGPELPFSGEPMTRIRLAGREGAFWVCVTSGEKASRC